MVVVMQGFMKGLLIVMIGGSRKETESDLMEFHLGCPMGGYVHQSKQYLLINTTLNSSSISQHRSISYL